MSVCEPDWDQRSGRSLVAIVTVLSLHHCVFIQQPILIGAHSLVFQMVVLHISKVSRFVCPFRSQAFELLCDLLLLYSVGSVRTLPELQTLVYIPSDSLRSELAAFLVDYVFTEPEEAELDGKARNTVTGFLISTEIIIYTLYIHLTLMSHGNVLNISVYYHCYYGSLFFIIQSYSILLQHQLKK